jgi:molybdenum cofactor biosynthesis enzyme MoaA
LLRRDFVKLCEELGALPGLDNLAITTNALVLERKLPALKTAGVNLLNISLDTLVPAKFELITRRRGHARVVSAINAAVELGFSPVKVNCVVKRGMNEDELVDFVEWTRHSPIQVRFIEYMPFDDNKWDNKRMLPYFEMVDMIRQKYPDFDRSREMDGSNPTSKTWQVPGFAGSIGFISSMSDAFCGSCNRMRITADGNVKACLFGADELSLRDPMRDGVSDAGLRELIAKSVTAKNAKLGGHANAEAIAAAPNRPMILIGG